MHCIGHPIGKEIWTDIRILFLFLFLWERVNTVTSGLAGGLLDKHYKIAHFDERYDQEALRKSMFSELYEALLNSESMDIIGRGRSECR